MLISQAPLLFSPPQSPQFDRWSSNSQGKRDSLKLGLRQSGRGSHNLQFPQPEDEDPLSPGYTEPLCVSVSENFPKFNGLY